MSCGKITYKSRAEAVDSINGINKDKRVRRSKNQPKRAYFCDACNGYHLTSAKKKRRVNHVSKAEVNTSLSKGRKSRTLLKIKDYTSKK